MWGSYGYKQAVSQRHGYSEQTEKQTQQYLFKGYCLQINKCKYPKSALHCPFLSMDSFMCLPEKWFYIHLPELSTCHLGFCLV